MGDVPLSVHLLGGFSLHVAGEPVPDGAWRLRKAKSLIKLLALTPERRLHRDRACELLWPDRDAESAANNLHQALHSARRALDAAHSGGGAQLVMRDEAIMFADPQPRIDSVEFEAAAATARAAGDIASHLAALEFYEGELLPEDRYEDWTVATRESVRESHQQLLLELSELRADEGDGAGAVEALQEAIVSEPLNEESHRELMRLYASDGRRQQALAQYAQLRAALKAEYEADPDELTRELYQSILSEKFESTGNRAPRAGAVSREREAGNLPHLLTSFIGRDRELTTVDEMTIRSRLVTLTGPGGSGKTRLALEAARSMRDRFDDGVFLIELAGIGSASLVGQQAASVFGVDVRSERDPIDVLIRHLKSRNLLIVLDNCEHLIDACADFAARLLAACPDVRLLATSREQLQIQGEVTWRVPSLALPERGVTVAAELRNYASVQLFCERAAAASSDFELTDENAAAVAEICFGLDGMPLAIELAAARSGALAPQQLAERLDDALGLLSTGQRGGLTRQQTLEATIGWSYKLLDEAERVLFRRLGVFAGGFTLDAIEAVCADDQLPATDAAAVLARLIDKSLVAVDDSTRARRYRMLVTIRQFALRQLRAADEAALLEATFCDWCLDFATGNDPQQNSGYAPIDTDLVDGEHDNLRAALALMLDRDPLKAMELAMHLSPFWMVRGRFAEGTQWISAVLAASPGPTRMRARTLHVACGFAVRRGKTGTLVSNMIEATEIYRGANDTRSLTVAAQQLAVMQWATCELDAAEATLEETIERASELGMTEVEATSKHAESLISYTRSDYAAAQCSLRECLSLLEHVSPDAKPAFWVTTPGINMVSDSGSAPPRLFFEETVMHFRRVDNSIASAYVLCDLANAARSASDLTTASDALDRALALFEASGDRYGLSLALNASGNLARTRGDFDVAQRLLERSNEARQQLGDARAMRMNVGNRGLLAARRGDMDQARALVNEFIALSERSDDEPAAAGGLLNLGNLELDAGEPARALVLLEESSARASSQLLGRAAAWSRLAQLEATIELGLVDQSTECAAAASADLLALRDTQGLERLAALESRIAAETGGKYAAKPLLRADRDASEH